MHVNSEVNTRLRAQDQVNLTESQSLALSRSYRAKARLQGIPTKSVVSAPNPQPPTPPPPLTSHPPPPHRPPHPPPMTTPPPGGSPTPRPRGRPPRPGSRPQPTPSATASSPPHPLFPASRM